VSLTGRSLFCDRFAREGETVLADWLIYYIQVSLSVKDFIRPISKLVCQTTSFFSLRFLGRKRIICIRRFLSRAFLKLILLLEIKFLFFVPDSEGQLYAYLPESQEVFVQFGTF
jgi:hypothetical protein